VTTQLLTNCMVQYIFMGTAAVHKSVKESGSTAITASGQLIYNCFHGFFSHGKSSFFF